MRQRQAFKAIVCLLLLVLPALVFADFSGRVVGVTDGDTIKVMHNGRAEKIRLNGIDCPEKGQPFGTKAKQFTSEMVFGKEVTVQDHGKDNKKYRRTLGDIILPDGRSLNRELVTAGFAWWYRKYSKDTSLGQLEEEARSAKRGLWADPNPVPPWCYRKKQKGQEC
jgi:endonuclease YncB( thermonuclease family)